MAAVAQLGAEEVGEVFQQGFRIIRAQADEADGGIKAVEQEMRADTGGQRAEAASETEGARPLRREPS